MSAVCICFRRLSVTAFKIEGNPPIRRENDTPAGG
ncbi:hypothetical protein GXY_07130 [Novacetimonas hansenii ATCC 23769]|uniref:Uncharacterized protein n=1 Tax=Novacetimonas hansenii ATCC 23769 TaxID=714995 RepID=D5QE63_NOVHA|nr:hypothetical protein GXY_07130 [Novacetimonas hansenii ATCC 23769]